MDEEIDAAHEDAMPTITPRDIQLAIDSAMPQLNAYAEALATARDVLDTEQEQLDAVLKNISIIRTEAARGANTLSARGRNRLHTLVRLGDEESLTSMDATATAAMQTKNMAFMNVLPIRAALMQIHEMVQEEATPLAKKAL